MHAQIAPTTFLEGFYQTTLNPLSTMHYLIIGDGKISSIRKLSDLAKDFFETFHYILPHHAPDFSAAIHICKIINEGSKTVKVADVAHKIYMNKPLTHYSYLKKPTHLVKASAVAVMSISHLFFLFSTYFVNEWHLLTRETVSLFSFISYSFGGESGLWIAQTVTTISLDTLQKGSSLLFFSIKSWQLYSEYQDKSTIMTSQEIVLYLTGSIENLGQATLFALSLCNVALPLLLCGSLVVSTLAIVQQRQKILFRSYLAKRGAILMDQLVNTPTDGSSVTSFSKTDHRVMQLALKKCYNN